jgi:hypothetical protein
VHLHLAFLLAGQEVTTKKTGFDWTLFWTIVGALAAVIALFGPSDYLRSRPQFGVDPRLYEDNEVWVQVARKGGAPNGYISSIKVVVVKSSLYKFLRHIRRNDYLGAIPLAALPTLTGAYTDADPATASIYLAREDNLPPRWNPFGRFRRRSWSRHEIRLEISMAGKRARRYMRLKSLAGRVPRDDKKQQSPADEPSVAEKAPVDPHSTA